MSHPAQGPLRFLLQSTPGQYAIVGFGFYTAFPQEVRRILAPLLIDNPQLTSLGEGAQAKNGGGWSQQAPIIIQTPTPTVVSNNNSSNGIGRGLFGIVAYAVVGAGVCWAGYAIFTNVLPEALSQMLPVTRQIFEETSKLLGKGIHNVKEVLEEKILGLGTKQDQLGRKQDETNEAVEEVQKELGEARLDLLLLKDALDRCQGSLDDNKDMQGYTLKGVKLLIRCVTSLIPAENDIFDEIVEFIDEEDGADEKIYGKSSSKGSFSSSSKDSFSSSNKGSCRSNSMSALPEFGSPMNTPFAHAVRASSMSTPLKDIGESSAVIRDIHALLGH